MPNTILIEIGIYYFHKEDDDMQMVVILIGICAVALLLWFVYILMKGDERI